MKKSLYWLVSLSIFFLTLSWFTCAFADPVLINLSPNRGMIGSTITMTARDLDVQSTTNNRVFINDVIAPVRRVYQVTGSEDTYKLIFTVPANVTDEPTMSPTTVPVRVEVNGIQSNIVDFSLLPSPMITDVEPASGNQGDSMDVDIHAVNTRFRGRLRVNFGKGITVSHVSLNSSTSLTASIQIADDAALGLRDLTIMAGRLRLRKPGAFTVTAPASQETTLSLSVNPVPSPVFSRSVIISGNVNTGAGAGGQPQSQVPTVITSLIPSNASQGQELIVKIKGMNTHFSPQSTQLSFGTGIEVIETNVISQEEMTAKIKIDPGATIGERRVIAISNEEEANSVVAFNIEPGTMSVTGKITDQEGNPIAGATVSIKGLNIHAETDDNGVFTIAAMPSGKQKLVLNARNFASAEFEINGKNGQTLDLTSAPIGLERKAVSQGGQTGADLFSLLARGANRIVPPHSIEETKQLIIDSIITLGGETLGVLDENGTQLNPQIDGDGYWSLSPTAVANMATEWCITGYSLTLKDILFFFNTIAGWDPEPPDYSTWLDALNQQLQAAWSDQDYPARDGFLFIFNKGSLLDAPPRLTLDTVLNPIQSFLLIGSYIAFVHDAYLYEDIPPAQNSGGNTQVAALDIQYRNTISDMDPSWMLMADISEHCSQQGSGNNDDKCTSWVKLWINIQNFIIANKAQITKKIQSTLKDIIENPTKPPIPMEVALARHTKIFKFIKGLESSTTNFADQQAGKAFAAIINPLFGEMKRLTLEYLRPPAPEITELYQVNNEAGYQVVLRFKPVPGDNLIKALPDYVYQIFRRDRFGNVYMLVSQPSYKFSKGGGNLIFIDTAPDIGSNSYYVRAAIRRGPVRQSKMMRNWNKNFFYSLASSISPGGVLLSTLESVLGMIDDIYSSIVFQYSALSAPKNLIVAPYKAPPGLDVVVDRWNEREYVSVSPMNSIFLKTTNGWQPLINVHFAEPHQRGLAVDSDGLLYTVNAASEEKFGGRIFGFRDAPTLDPKSGISSGNRFLLGTVNYYSPILFYAKPVQATDLLMGHWNNFIADYFFDPESLAILDFGTQGVKVLNRRYGQEVGPWPDRNVAQTIIALPDGILTPISHLAQSPLALNHCFITGGDNIWYVEPGDSHAHKLFDDETPLPFSDLSDLVFDYSGNLYFLDADQGNLYVVNSGAVVRSYFYNLPLTSEDVCLLEDGLDTPLSIAISADDQRILVTDATGVHSFEKLVPIEIPEGQQDRFQISTVLVDSGDGLMPVKRCHNKYLLIDKPSPSPKEPVNLTLVCNNNSCGDYGDQIVKVTGTSACYVSLSEQQTDTGTKVIFDQSEFSFNLNTSSDQAGKIVLRNIQIPSVRIVPQDNNDTSPQPRFDSEDVIPESADFPCIQKDPVLLFAPEEIANDQPSIFIKGYVLKGVNRIRLFTDIQPPKDIQITPNGTFQETIPAHKGVNIINLQVEIDGENPFTITRAIRSVPNPKATLTGVLVDETSKNPIPYKHIFIPEIAGEVVSDVNGFYSVLIPVSGSLSVHIYQ